MKGFPFFFIENWDAFLFKLKFVVSCYLLLDELAHAMIDVPLSFIITT